MAWTKVYHDTSRQDQIQTTADDKGQITQQVMETWIAVSDSIADTPLTAEIANDGIKSVPVVGLYYTLSNQPGFYCNSRIPKRMSESPYVYEIQVQYTRSFMKPPQQDKWNIDISIKGQKTTQPAYQDMNGNDIINKAGQAFTDPALTETLYDEVIEISYNTQDADSSTFAGLRGKVCSGGCSFNVQGMSRTFEARQLLCDEITMSTTITADDNSTPIWKVAITLIGRQDTFTDHVLEQGFMQLNSAGKLIPIQDLYSQGPVSSPARLDNNGHAITNPNAPGVYNDHKIQGEADLSPLFEGLS